MLFRSAGSFDRRKREFGSARRVRLGVALVQEHAVPFVPLLCASLQSLLRSPLCSAKKHVLPSKIGTRPAPISAAPSPAHQDTPERVCSSGAEEPMLLGRKRRPPHSDLRLTGRGAPEDSESGRALGALAWVRRTVSAAGSSRCKRRGSGGAKRVNGRSEEHTAELQSPSGSRMPSSA